MSIKKAKEIGLNVIPLRPNSKIPFLSSWRKYMEQEFTGTYPSNCNYGAILGRLSGFVVIDSDTKEAEEYIAKKFPKTTLMSKTKKGYHRFYRHPNYHVNNTNKVVPMGGADLKADGGYVVIPPSKFEDGSGFYEWIAFNQNNIPVFDLEWLHGKQNRAFKSFTGVIASNNQKLNELILLLQDKKAIMQKNTNTNYNVYVKACVEAIKELKLEYDTTKTGPMKSKEHHINGYMFLDHTGLSIGSFTGGIFFNLKLSLADQAFNIGV